MERETERQRETERERETERQRERETERYRYRYIYRYICIRSVANKCKPKRPNAVSIHSPSCPVAILIQSLGI